MAEIAAKSRKFPGNLMKFRRAKIRIRPLLQKTLLQEKLSRKSPWSRTSRVVELSVSNLAKEATVDGSKTNKRRKLDVIEEKDPFAFDEDDVTTQGSKKIVSQSNAITKQRITNQALTTEFTDKSTDDEAYSSSQEWSETSSQGGEKKVSSNYRKKPTGVSLSIFC